MRRWLGWIAILLMLTLGAIALSAYGNASTHTSLADRTRAVAQSLRCPVCQGESVADSPSKISQDMRRLIGKDLTAGMSPDQIRAYFVSRYGPWILLSPPASGVGSLVWLAPPLLILGGVALLLTLIADWRRARPAETAKSAYIERVRAELAESTVE